ncbi:uncharacterized [Tachysurus ichikawai]
MRYAFNSTQHHHELEGNKEFEGLIKPKMVCCMDLDIALYLHHVLGLFTIPDQLSQYGFIQDDDVWL